MQIRIRNLNADVHDSHLVKRLGERGFQKLCIPMKKSWLHPWYPCFDCTYIVCEKRKCSIKKILANHNNFWKRVSMTSLFLISILQVIQWHIIILVLCRHDNLFTDRNVGFLMYFLSFLQQLFAPLLTFLYFINSHNLPNRFVGFHVFL